MLPRTYPVNSAGKVPIYAVGGSGVPWVDHIPVLQVTPGTGKTGTYDEDGAIDTVSLSGAEASGLVRWVDYLPVHSVADNSRWRAENNGYIPVTDYSAG